MTPVTFTLRTVQLEVVQSATLLQDLQDRPFELDATRIIETVLDLLDRASAQIRDELENKAL